jgi:hypothetical protein
MAYFIFLKSLRSIEEFRNNSHVKIPPKSPCANFIRKRIFPDTFGPPGLSAQSLFFTGRFSLPSPTGPRPPGRPSPPARPNRPPSSSSHTDVGRAWRCRRLASRRLHGRPDASTGRKENGCINPHHFPPLLKAISPLQLLVTGAFNAGR